MLKFGPMLKGIRLHLLVLALPIFSCLAQAQAVLENFAAARNNFGNAGPLWDAYNGGGCTGNSWTIGSSQGIDANTGNPGDCPYIHFFPDGTNGYFYPQGYAQFYILSGSWNPQYNRLTYTMTCNATITSGSDGFADYIRDPLDINGGDSSYQGQHYYHGTSLQRIVANHAVTWIINRTPNHQVGSASSINWPNDPEWVLPTGNQSAIAHPVHYFDGLTRFYLNPTRQASSPTQCTYSSFNFSTAAGEPDEYVYTLMGNYDGSSYNIAWHTPNNDSTPYLIHYSTSGSMHVGGFSTGTNAGTITAPGNTYDYVTWTSPAMTQAANMWVAIRPQPLVIGATGNGVSPIRLSLPADAMYGNNDQVTVSGIGGNTAANGTWNITPVPRQFWRFYDGTLGSIVVSGGIATVTTPMAHNLKVGQIVLLYNVTDSSVWSYGPTSAVTSVPTSTTFTTTTTEPNGTYNSGNTPSLQVWAMPAIDLQGSTGNGAYTSGGRVAATSDTTNFSEIYLPGVDVNSCDINSDGVVNTLDVNLAIAQALGSTACTADLEQTGTCNAVDVQRVVNAALGASCRVGP
jgi:hypothetical protein